jgi:iron-sulfur cluster repair protein YtfE (RIC family)
MSDLDKGLIGFFSHDHRACDELWGTVERAGVKGDKAVARQAWEAFQSAMRRHFAMEEEVLFPAFEAATGMRGGPTMVMREEHVQMRSLLDRMAAQAASGDFAGLVDMGDTLLMLIQQHNIKEEGMLYPMAEQALGGRWAEVAARLKAYGV